MLGCLYSASLLLMVDVAECRILVFTSTHAVNWRVVQEVT